jgi:hypothetical protein
MHLLTAKPSPLCAIYSTVPNFNMRKYFLLIICFIFLKASSQTKNNSEKIRINSACDQIMTAFKEQDFDKVIGLLKQNSVIDPTSIDSLKPIIVNVMSENTRDYGKFLGMEYILEKSAGQVASKRYYAIKFERYFLKCQFSLYNNSKRWMITGFSFNEEFADLF